MDENDQNNQNNCTDDDDTPEHNPEVKYDNTQTIPEEEKNETDEYVTIGDIKIILEMYKSNRESENAEDEEDEDKEIRTKERYNLRQRPKN